MYRNIGGYRMGLRFRKSIKILPGVKLNLGTKSASVSVGKKGMHYTMSTTGRKTVSVGLPGTGLSYVKTIGSGNKNQKAKSTTGYRTGGSASQTSYGQSSYGQNQTNPTKEQELAFAQQEEAKYQEYVDNLRSLHKQCDEEVNWRAVVDGDMSAYAYDKVQDIALDVLGGNPDAYYTAVERMEPFEDLRDFGTAFEFGTDNGDFAEVQFCIAEQEVMPVIEVSVSQSGKLTKKELSKTRYYELLEDYVCSTCIRTARDTFALLPVNVVYVHAVQTSLNPATGLDEEETIVSVKFTRDWFLKVAFDRIDPSEFMTLFECRKKCGKTTGFSPVIRLSSEQ